MHPRRMVRRKKCSEESSFKIRDGIERIETMEYRANVSFRYLRLINPNLIMKLHFAGEFLEVVRQQNASITGLVLLDSEK